ncbi:astacin-like metalloprotease toxin 5 [Parasteatoda tepidariorum]|uniref:astacin-like metalloprotease toxin 5 n=1 Tax=Parasteatoda tepidariorum TaxID=114398 RepID=UPI00077FCCF7|nr:astacin-like metalloprotease toxin 5 isoform X2 [Parasteatoda tepidariorum]
MLILLLLSLFSLTWTTEVHHDPMINEGMFEGDMLGVEVDEDRNAIPRDSQRWPDGVIPYFISPELSRLTSEIRRAMKHIEDSTCIRFVERTNQEDHIKIFRDSGCYSHWGRIGRQQLLSLGYGCDPFGTIVHELLHAIGFEHEHNRSDRDEYLIINWQNIENQWYYAFEKLAPQQNRLLSSFDFKSIMLYGSNSFAKERGKYSMTDKSGGVLVPVHRKDAMSASDIYRINKLYECRV